MRMMVLAGVALLAVALNVQAVGPSKALNETRLATAKNAQDASYKVKPIVPLWQNATKANDADKLSAAKRPNCSMYTDETSCEATGYCVWLVSPDRGGYCTSGISRK